jgi:hypothetical protein
MCLCMYTLHMYYVAFPGAQSYLISRLQVLLPLSSLICRYQQSAATVVQLATSDSNSRPRRYEHAEPIC